jgi:hypothetical protein
VVRSGAVAAFATLVGWATLCVEGCLPVRCFRPAVVDFLVTGFAGLGSHILGGFRRRRTGRGWAGGLRILVRCHGLRGGERQHRDCGRDQQPAHEPGMSFSQFRRAHKSIRQLLLRRSARRMGCREGRFGMYVIAVTGAAFP